MRVSSSDTLSTIRWIWNGMTVIWGIVLIVLFIPDDGVLSGALSGSFSHISLWIVSIYALMFANETAKEYEEKCPELITKRNYKYNSQYRKSMEKDGFIPLKWDEVSVEEI